MKKVKPYISKIQIAQTGPTSNNNEFTSSKGGPIVGIGASAGGLETFTQLLTEIPCDTGMAFVLIQHLDPTHASFLTEALSKTTQMPVCEIEDGMKASPNSVYVIPPGSDVGILHGQFTLFPREKTIRKPHMAIDFFFRALAVDCRNQAIGVVLSGTATDGTEGLRAIKAENGVTFAQDPKSAKFDGMPQSAVNAEVVDFCLPIPELAIELTRLAHHPYISGRGGDPLSQPKDAQDLQKVFVLLRTIAGIDFSEYKPPTIKRRLARRLVLLKIDSLQNYIKFLQITPDEVKLLAADILIHVTSFFRDPEVFKNLQTNVFPEIAKSKNLSSPIRIWVTGCSSGEEVYSTAISLLEFLGERSSKHPIQIFGSDISEPMIEKARQGFYSDSSLRDINPERLRRFFVKVQGGYRINKLIRDLCVFVRHDLACDPPFSKLDLVTCRNVLIYFEQPLQKRIISTFHYCLNQPGFLVLGRSENISSHQHLFYVLDKTNKIFSREAVTSQLRFSTIQNNSIEKPLLPSIQSGLGRPAFDVVKQADNLLLSQYAPSGAVINAQMEVLQYRGDTSLYLQSPPGQPQLNLLKMVREGLFSALKMALVQAKEKMTIIRKDGLQFKQNSILQNCNLVVIPFTRPPESKELYFLVLFEAAPSQPFLQEESVKSRLTKREKIKEEKESQRSAKLEKELRATQEYLQSLNEDHQKTNDVLNSVNEELTSGNEELQSMNEELETAKEELQSTNEELSTVNDELQNRNQETAQINDDFINLLNSVEIPIVILDLDRRIRRFTPKAGNIMNLLVSDIGRPIDDIRPNIAVENLDQQIRHVIDTVTTNESEVKDREGRWHRLQIRPYKTIDNKIAGAVLSLINIDMLKRAVNDAEWMRDYSTSIVEAVQVPLLVLDEKIKVISANQAFYDSFKVSRTETEGKNLYELGGGQWNIENLKTLLGEMLEKKTSFLNTEVTLEGSQRGARTMALSARPTQFHDRKPMILLTIEDVTERRELLHQTEKARAEADRANLTKDLFLATLSHELRTPLTSILLQAQMLQRGDFDAKVKRSSLIMERSALAQARLVEDLLDVSRIVTGKLRMEPTTVNLSELSEVICAAIDTVSAMAENKSIAIESDLEDSAKYLYGDPIRLQQIVWNLLTNAIKFSPKGSKVSVNLKTMEGQAVIQVIDRGIGIMPEFLPHVFERFSQADGTSIRTYGGLGLGLAIVRHLVEMHEGTVKVESSGKDKGAIFTVMLPLIKAVAKNAGSQLLKSVTSPANVSKNGRPIKLDGLRILVVEDDPEALETISEMLKLAGADVRSAASAIDAMEVLKVFAPHELVLDIAMPGEDGYSLLRRIRKLDSIEGKPIPALALTAFASEKDRQKTFSAGFQMHLSKPVDIDRLTGALFELSERNHIVVH